MLSLQHPYISVAMRYGNSYGGGQQFSENAMLRRCGCGVIAATDLLLYLSRRDPMEVPACFAGLSDEGPLPFSVYNDCVLRMNRQYFPVIPYAGINGLMLMAGVNRFFREYKIPYTARWCFGQSALRDRIALMLRADIPVILSAGQNIPFFWQDKRVCFYRKDARGTYLPASGAKAHFISVTGMDGAWLRISSWGRMYYLNRWEYEDYVRRHSCSAVCNILLVERK